VAELASTGTLPPLLVLPPMPVLPPLLVLPPFVLTPPVAVVPPVVAIPPVEVVPPVADVPPVALTPPVAGAASERAALESGWLTVAASLEQLPMVAATSRKPATRRTRSRQGAAAEAACETEFGMARVLLRIQWTPIDKGDGAREHLQEGLGRA
jgi:hypothetical protein